MFIAYLYIYILLLIKQFFEEKKKSSRAAFESQTQFWIRIISGKENLRLANR